MPKISNRGVIMPASPIRKLVPLSNAAKSRGIKVYHLNIGQPDLPTPPEALEALKHIDRKVLEYSPSDGIRSLREKLATYYHRFNIDVTPDDIIVTVGGSEAVLFAFMACLDPGDEIIVPEPAYANYMAFAISAGAVIKTVTSSIDEGFALPPVEKFEELITPRTKGILICNPNNPTGYLYTQSEMNQLRDIVKKYDLFLFSDEVYREFCYTGAPYISAFHLKGIGEQVVLMDSVSARYSESVSRLGATFTKHAEVKKKVMSMYTDPLHVHVEDPGHLEGNAVFTYLDAFCQPQHFEAFWPDYANLDEVKEHYQRGGLGDMKVKKFLNNILQAELEPIRQRRAEFEKDIPAVYEMLRKGCEEAREVAAKTLDDVRRAMKINYFDDAELIAEQSKRFAR